MRPLSIRARLTLWYSAVVVAILLLVSAAAYSLLRWHLFNDLDASLFTVAGVLRDAPPADPAAPLPADLEPLVREFLGSEFADALLQLLDPEGRVRSRALRPGLPPSREARINALRGAPRIRAEDLSRRLERRGTQDEIDRLADTLNAMLARLEAAFGEMQRFTADAAHELRTPLTALRGGIEIALRAPRSPDEYRRVLASSIEEVDQLIRLAEDLLLLSRSTVGLTATRQPVDLESVCLEALELGVRLAKGKGVTVSMGATAPAMVQGDAAALRRALLNLVDNAVKYTPAGGSVVISLERTGEHVALVVEDTGIGIDSTDTRRIFEPFVRLDAGRSRDT